MKAAIGLISWESVENQNYCILHCIPYYGGIPPYRELLLPDNTVTDGVTVQRYCIRACYTDIYGLYVVIVHTALAWTGSHVLLGWSLTRSSQWVFFIQVCFGIFRVFVLSSFVLALLHSSSPCRIHWQLYASPKQKLITSYMWFIALTLQKDKIYSLHGIWCHTQRTVRDDW